MSVVASPDYLARHGTPAHPDDLTRLKGIGWTFCRTIGGWPVREGQRLVEVSAPPVGRASDGDAARLLALGGAGIARLAIFHIGPDIEAGRLISILDELNPGDREDIDRKSTRLNSSH